MKNKKLPGFYVHTDISRTGMNYWDEISLNEVTKSINYQKVNKKKKMPS